MEQPPSSFFYHILKKKTTLKDSISLLKIFQLSSLLQEKKKIATTNTAPYKMSNSTGRYVKKKVFYLLLRDSHYYLKL